MDKLECRSCGEYKDISEFPKDTCKPFGVGTECKKCLAARAKAKRAGISCVNIRWDSTSICTSCGESKELTLVNFYPVKSS